MLYSAPFVELSIEPIYVCGRLSCRVYKGTFGDQKLTGIVCR